MTRTFTQFAFSPSVKATQARYGARELGERLEQKEQANDRLSADIIAFIEGADSVEQLLQRWPALGLAVPPLSPTAYRDVITKPAEVYTERVRRLVAEPALADKLVHRF